MKLNDIETLARYIADNNGLTTDTPDHRLAIADRVDLAKALLLVLPVVRAAMYWRSEENYMGDRRVGMRALVDAVDTLRAALEGK